MPVVSLLLSLRPQAPCPTAALEEAGASWAMAGPDRVAVALDHGHERPIDVLHAALLALPGVEAAALVGMWDDRPVATSGMETPSRIRTRPAPGDHP